MSERTRNSTSNSFVFRLTTAGVGTAKTGLDVTTLKLQYIIPGSNPSTATSLTLLAAATTAFTAYGARELDATNSPGLYRVDVPDAAFAGTPNEVEITINGTAIEPCTRTIDVTDVNTRNGGAKLPVTVAAGDLAVGAIDFPQMTNALKSLLIRGYLVSTGVTTPLSADIWFVGGFYGTSSFYQSFTTGLVAWYNGAGWTISTAVGVNGTSYWTTAANVTVVGPYTANGATGVPTIVAHGNAILATFQPDTPVPSVSAIAAGLFVDGATNLLKVNADHSVNSTGGGGGGGGGGTIVNYITVPAAVAIASQDPAVITCIRGDTLRILLPLAGDLTNRTKLVMTAKSNLNDSDSLAVLQIVEGTGLVRVNGEIPADASSASLVVVDTLTGTVNLVIDAQITAKLAVCDLVWDVQAFFSTGIVSPIRGTFAVVADVTQAVT